MIKYCTRSCELTQKHLPPFLQTDIEITREEDFARILQMEEEFIQQMCEHLIKVKPDLIITEKGISGKAHVHSYSDGAWQFSVYFPVSNVTRLFFFFF